MVGSGLPKPGDRDSLLIVEVVAKLVWLMRQHRTPGTCWPSTSFCLCHVIQNGSRFPVMNRYFDPTERSVSVVKLLRDISDGSVSIY